jgi:hypothetical protein
MSIFNDLSIVDKIEMKISVHLPGAHKYSYYYGEEGLRHFKRDIDKYYAKEVLKNHSTEITKKGFSLEALEKGLESEDESIFNYTAAVIANISETE